jgi:hypothetical protein
MMNAAALSFTPSGPPYDPANPLARPIVFSDIAERLARSIRFNANAGALSVLQHQVMGADAIANEGGSGLDCALFLHHDDHEFILGEETRPVADAKESVIPGYRDGIALLKDNWDTAIYQKLQLPPPVAWSVASRAIVRGMDLRMQAAESRALFGASAQAAYDHAARKPPRFADRDQKARGGPLGTLWPPALAVERWFDAHRKFTGRSIR